MADGELWQGVVERLGWGGQGIARAADGRLILLDAPRTLVPGEEVEARVEWKARHGAGMVTRWVAVDPRRVLPAGTPFMAVGQASVPASSAVRGHGGPRHQAPLHPGYPLLGLPRGLADELKRQMVADLLHRALPDAPAPEWLAAPDDARRSRIQLHWDGARLGPHARGTHDIVEIDADLLAAPALSAAIPTLREALAAGSLPAAPARWELATGTPDGDVRASMGGETWRLPVGAAHGRPAPDSMPPLSAPPMGGAYADASPLHHHLGTATLQQHPRAFFQACPAWAWAAFTQVLCGWDPRGATFFDLYGGGGFFSRLLAGRFARYVLVESSPLSVLDARVNLAGMNAMLQAADVARGLTAQPPGWAGAEDTVLLDPPRAGLAPDAATRIRDCGAGQVVLAGCDGAAFTRDIRRITDGGRWRLDRLAVIDLFPFTPEVECVGLLKKSRVVQKSQDAA